MTELLPLLVFTTFGGIAAGAYAVSAFKALIPTSGEAGEQAGFAAHKPWLFPLVCIVLLGIGLLGTLAHLGQPLRFINGMLNPGSMISQESYWAISFGLLMAIDLALVWFKGVSSKVVRTLGAVAACGMMVVTGLAYYRCAFIDVWASALTVPLFVVGDIAMGVALCMLFTRIDAYERALHGADIVVAVVWLCTTVAFALHMAACDQSVAVVAAGAIVGPVAAGILSACVMRGALKADKAGYAILALAFIGVVVIRGAFFAAGVL